MIANSSVLVCQCANTMIVCSYTLSDYRNSFYGAALAQGSVSLTGSTLIRRQNEVTCL
jgi:hypothetical protein